jgi:hypothetical protein
MSEHQRHFGIVPSLAHEGTGLLLLLHGLLANRPHAVFGRLMTIRESRVVSTYLATCQEVSLPLSVEAGENAECCIEREKKRFAGKFELTSSRRCDSSLFLLVVMMMLAMVTRDAVHRLCWQQGDSLRLFILLYSYRLIISWSKMGLVLFRPRWTCPL